MSKQIDLVKLFNQTRNLNSRRFNEAKKIIGNQMKKLPPMEDVLFVLLFVFSATFGVLLFGIGEQIKNEDILPAANVSGPNELEKDIQKMVAGHPIEKMAPYISRQNEDVAAYLVAIAKKESNWGRLSPQKDGKNCYNYWGYRGTYNQTDSGYSCFDSPRQAVRVVGGRIAELLAQNIDTPGEMVVWKCGSSCAGHDPAGVDKWIRDVGFYYRKF